MAAGWGIQFQQPLFLTAMAVLLTLFACNLFGFFEIPLPRALADVAGGGQGHGRGHGLVGHFLDRRLRDPAGDPLFGAVPGHRGGLRLGAGARRDLIIFRGPRGRARAALYRRGCVSGAGDAACPGRGPGW